MSEKKQAIINAAVTLFSERGVSRTTAADIAKAAGVKKATLLAYFPHMSAIHNEILRQFAVSLKKSLLSTAYINSVIDTQSPARLLNQLLPGMDDQDEVLFLRRAYKVVCAALQNGDPQALIVERLLDTAVSRLAYAIDRLIERGLLAPTDASVCAVIWMGARFNGVMHPLDIIEKGALQP